MRQRTGPVLPATKQQVWSRPQDGWALPLERSLRSLSYRFEIQWLVHYDGLYFEGAWTIWWGASNPPKVRKLLRGWRPLEGWRRQRESQCVRASMNHYCCDFKTLHSGSELICESSRKRWRPSDAKSHSVRQSMTEHRSMIVNVISQKSVEACCMCRPAVLQLQALSALTALWALWSHAWLIKVDCDYWRGVMKWHEPISLEYICGFCVCLKCFSTSVLWRAWRLGISLFWTCCMLMAALWLRTLPRNCSLSWMWWTCVRGFWYER